MCTHNTSSPLDAPTKLPLSPGVSRDGKSIFVFIDDESLSCHDEMLKPFFHGMGLVANLNGIAMGTIDRFISSPRSLMSILANGDMMSEYSRAFLLFTRPEPPKFPLDLDAVIPTKVFQILSDGQYVMIFPRASLENTFAE